MAANVNVQIPKFKGGAMAPGEVNQFLNQYEAYFAATGQEADQKAKLIVNCLRDRAQIWFDCVQHDTPDVLNTWAEFEKAFRSRFAGKVSLNTHVENLRRISQDKTESVQDFYDRCGQTIRITTPEADYSAEPNATRTSDLFKRGVKLESERHYQINLTKLFFQGLLPAIRDSVSDKEYDSGEELRTLAMYAEKALISKGLRKDPAFTLSRAKADADNNVYGGVANVHAIAEDEGAAEAEDVDVEVERNRMEETEIVSNVHIVSKPATKNRHVGQSILT